MFTSQKTWKIADGNKVKSYRNFQLYFVQIEFVLTLRVEKKIERTSEDKKVSYKKKKKKKNWVREINLFDCSSYEYSRETHMEEKPCGTEEFSHGVFRWETFKENQIVFVYVNGILTPEC